MGDMEEPVDPISISSNSTGLTDLFAVPPGETPGELDRYPVLFGLEDRGLFYGPVTGSMGKSFAVAKGKVGVCFLMVMRSPCSSSWGKIDLSWAMDPG